MGSEGRGTVGGVSSGAVRSSIASGPAPPCVPSLRYLRRAVSCPATMPECPELHLAGRYINEACGALVFSGGVERSAVGRGPEVPFSSEAYRISAAARGKELRLTLTPLGSSGAPQELVFRFGMSGSFRLCPAAQLPRHAHLRFRTRDSPPRVLCFIDVRRFGSWRLGDAWQEGRGPCVLSEYQAFR